MAEILKMHYQDKEFKNINANQFKAELRRLGIPEEDIDKFDIASMDHTNSLEEFKQYIKDEYGITEDPRNYNKEEIDAMMDEWAYQERLWKEKNKELIEEWTQKVTLPTDGVIIVTGKRGSGKTALGMYMLELAHQQGRKTAVFGFPIKKKHLLPDWIDIISDINNLPENAVILLDEASMNFYSRDSFTKINKMINKLISISRQKSQVLIFISHNLRKLDIGLILDADMLLMKMPSLFHSRFERSEVRQLIKEAEQELKDKSKEFVYCFSHDYIGLLKNPLPSFWSDDLSNAWAGISITDQNLEGKDLNTIVEYKVCRKCGRLMESINKTDWICHYCGYMQPYEVEKMLTVYGSDSCKPCNDLKKYLDMKGIKYKYIDITKKGNEKYAEYVYKKTGEIIIPVIETDDGKIIRGFSKQEVDNLD